MEEFDYVIIGAGLFGIYAAIDISKKGGKVLLIDKLNSPCKEASIVNQARIHTGYHYPRSYSTAKLADENNQRFIKDHENFINKSFDHYYGIDKYGSLTNSVQFERFSRFLKIPLEKIELNAPFSSDRLSATYKVQEYTFDPFLIRQHYLANLERKRNIKTLWFTEVFKASKNKNFWEIKLKNKYDCKYLKIKAHNVINATYAGINQINRIFGIKPLKLVYQTSEMVFIYSKELVGKGLTVMDGPFLSMMPYGKSGINSLSSVIYTHHNNIQDNEPNLDPYLTKRLEKKPRTNSIKMLKQLKQYLNKDVDIFNHGNLYTIKTKLMSSYIDDSRPTKIFKESDKPGYYVLFSGKVSSIYEFPKLW